MKEFLKRANIEGFDSDAFINAGANNFTKLPNVAIALSGGGYRALMNGGGFVAAADSRTAGTTDKGGIGGLLQSSTYLAGLSGGGWMVTSLYANNFSSVEALRDNVWKFDRSIFVGPAEDSGIGVLNTAGYWTDVADQVASKADAGFETSMTDYWGRALSYQMIRDTEGGPAYTFSSFAEDDDFKKGNQPMPILVADGRRPGEKIISLNDTVYEFNPFEMGTFDPTVHGFIPLKYLGSNFSNGVVPSSGKCVRGYDQAGFVMGTSSSLFNAFLLQVNDYKDLVPEVLLNAVMSILEVLDEADNDISQVMPNPYLGWNKETNPIADEPELDLVDGGLDLQNIPLHPLIQPARAVDVIFAVDSSADTSNWPNGTALRATYDRSLSPMANGTLFPPVPDVNTMINLGLNKRPTFFGCDAGNFTLSRGQVVPPLVVYVPMAPYTVMSNVTTFQDSYSNAFRNDAIRNGLNAATQGNGTIDAQWPTCVACAVLSRSLDRTGTEVPRACRECFDRYCWDGTLDKKEPAPYLPDFIIGNETTVEAESAATRSLNGGVASWSALVAAAAVGLAFVGLL